MSAEELRAVPWNEVTLRPADLVEPCSRHFRWRALIVCGPTALRLEAEGHEIATPQAVESWRMLAGLAQKVLDPVVDNFGALELTYGFAGPKLTRRIPGRIATNLDQHAASELNQRGHRICLRQGAAADFHVPGVDSKLLLDWLIGCVPFDRIYYYGPKKPVHVSWGIPQARLCWEMVRTPTGRRIPRLLSFGGRTK